MTDSPRPRSILPSAAAQLGATALRALARELAFDASRWQRYGARDGAAYKAYRRRARYLAAAARLATLADELACGERDGPLAGVGCDPSPCRKPPT
jgi:hypothetical protein